MTTITITSNPTSPTAYFDFTITLTLKNQFSELWTASTVVDVSGTMTLSGSSLQQTIVGGTGYCTFYVSSSGTLDITAKSSSVIGNLKITINQLVLIISSITPSVI